MINPISEVKLFVEFAKNPNLTVKNTVAILAAVAALGLSSSASAQFVADDFSDTPLGSHWTWVDSTPPGSTYTLTGSELTLKAAEGADLYFSVDKYTYLEQDAPAGTNWEVVTKIENFDPTEAGFQNSWNKCGLMLWQDNDHWFGVWVMGNDGLDGGGWGRWVEGSYQSWDSTRGGNQFAEFAGDQAYRNITADPVWLKIKKTEHGYMGLFSLDGVEWTQVNRLIRNSQNPADGYFQEEKIRIIQSGPGTNGTNDTAHFDFIESNPVTDIPTAAAGTNDEFDGSALDTNVWGVYEGVEASDIAVTDGKLQIAPADYNDQWGGIDKAVRVFQDAPVGGNWRVTVKAGPTELFSYQDWSGYGIMVWQDQNDYVFLSNAHANTGGHMIQTAYQRDDAYLWNEDSNDLVEDPLPRYLRITKTGTNYTASYSYDDAAYTELPAGGYDYPAELQNPQLQLIAKKVNDQGGPQLVAEFDWVHFEILANVNDWQLY